ncbi:MAG: 50S ribosomal protein L5 [Lentisphaeraceae bacterium]|nr:50S ribosomal protein L5 [Lentisphaeraceae bacterium]
MVVSIKDTYKNEIVAEMMKRFGYKNVNMVPKLQKIVLNSGVSTARERDVLQEAVNMLTTITGQKAVTTKARKSCASFKIREGQDIGAKVTLRNSIMFDFLSRLVNNALPRVRDFRGVKKGGFDGFGNYTMGVNDQSIFTELDLDKIKYQIGMNISFVTSAKTDEEGRALLELLGMPFEK